MWDFVYLLATSFQRYMIFCISQVLHRSSSDKNPNPEIPSLPLGGAKDNENLALEKRKIRKISGLEIEHGTVCHNLRLGWHRLLWKLSGQAIVNNSLWSLWRFAAKGKTCRWLSLGIPKGSFAGDIPEAQDRGLRVSFPLPMVPECCGPPTLTRKRTNACSIHHFPRVIAQQPEVTQLEKTTCIRGHKVPGLQFRA